LRQDHQELLTTSLPARGSVAGWNDETDSMRSRLAQQTGRAGAEVEAAVDRAMSRFDGARVREFVTLLAERQARLELSNGHRCNGHDE
jgi:hypothetical protein